MHSGVGPAGHQTQGLAFSASSPKDRGTEDGAEATQASRAKGAEAVEITGGRTITVIKYSVASTTTPFGRQIYFLPEKNYNSFRPFLLLQIIFKDFFFIIFLNLT